MNAHDRLRLYLEQRRELGETELMLDELPVDAVLKMIGAPPAKGAAARGATTASSIPTSNAAIANATGAQNAVGANTEANAEAKSVTSENSATAANTVAPSDPPPRFDNSVSTDWRAALSGLKPGAPSKPSESAQTEPTKAISTANSSTPTGLARGATASPRDDAGVAVPPSGTTPAIASTGSADSFPNWITALGMPLGLTANPSSNSASTTTAANSASSVEALATVIGSCRACALGALATNPVPGEGNVTADFVCVGEAPGQTEDETGRPFVGAAGQLLTKILGAIQLQREDVFICNVLKHRPPGNRNPMPDEIQACTPYLTRQLTLIQPKVILALGTFAAQTLLNTTTPLGKLRGQVHQYQGVPLIVTYHPAALLRNEAWKRPTWDDVKLARRILDAARQHDSQSPVT